MSDGNNESGGRTLGGGDPEPLPAGWGSSSAPRVGRIGQTSRCVEFHVDSRCPAETMIGPDDALNTKQSNYT